MALGSTQPLTEMSTRGTGGRGVGLTTLPPSCADCLEIWEPQPRGALRACPGCSGIALPLPSVWLMNMESWLWMHSYSDAVCREHARMWRSALGLCVPDSNKGEKQAVISVVN
jgi:hypothetical protein